MSRHELRPIFVVGCPRSGTTLLRLMLDSHPNISCGAEAHLFGPMQQMFDRWPSLRMFGFEREYWHEKMAEFINSFQMEYAEARGRKRWADKTPINALYLPFIDKVFPNCQVVHLLRNGRHVVASHRDSWGYKAALSSIEKWPRFVRAAQAFDNEAPGDRFHEVRYEDLVSKPEPTLRALIEFLDEPWDDIVLRYNEAPHDNYGYYDVMTESRRKATADTGLIYRSRIESGDGELDPILKTLFRLWAGKLNRKLGYERKES